MSDHPTADECTCPVPTGGHTHDVACPQYRPSKDEVDRGLLQMPDGNSYLRVPMPIIREMEELRAFRRAHETTDHSELLKKLPRVGSEFVDEVSKLSRQELEHRVLIQKDWLGSYAQCLDGLGLKVGVESCRDPRDIRRIVESGAALPRGDSRS